MSCRPSLGWAGKLLPLGRRDLPRPIPRRAKTGATCGITCWKYGELALGHDWFNAALDGTGDALEEMAVGMATLVTHPIRSVEGLGQLPSAVAALIASSPEYFARYSALPLQEQIREAARLSTHLLTLYGSAAGTTARVGYVGAKLPVLSLTAEGTLAIEQVLVPTSSSAAALGTGTGAVFVLMAAESAPKERGSPQAASGPGEWKRKKFSGSERARRYQEQIAGHSADDVYFIGKVEYDGFEAGILREAKAKGYLEFFDGRNPPVSLRAGAHLGYPGHLHATRALKRDA